jgi:tetratricopeptide (TPR) repeat protein
MHRLLWILLFLCCFSPSGATADDGDQKRYKALYELGLLNIGSPEGSEYFKKSVAENPNFAPPLYWIAYEACRTGNDPEAIRYFKKFLQVARGSEEAGRIRVATAILAELRSGMPGDDVAKIRSSDGGTESDS